MVTHLGSVHAGCKRTQASPDVADQDVDNQKKRAKKDDTRLPATKPSSAVAGKIAKKDTDKDAAAKPQQASNKQQQAKDDGVEVPVPMDEDEKQLVEAAEEPTAAEDSDQEADDAAVNEAATRRSSRSAAQGKKYKEKGEGKAKRDLVVKAEPEVDDEETAFEQTKGGNSTNTRR